MNRRGAYLRRQRDAIASNRMEDDGGPGGLPRIHPPISQASLTEQLARIDNAKIRREQQNARRLRAEALRTAPKEPRP